MKLHPFSLLGAPLQQAGKEREHRVHAFPHSRTGEYGGTDAQARIASVTN